MAIFTVSTVKRPLIIISIQQGVKRLQRPALSAALPVTFRPWRSLQRLTAAIKTADKRVNGGFQKLCRQILSSSQHSGVAFGNTKNTAETAKRHAESTKCFSLRN